MSKKIVHFILLVIFSIVFYKSILYTPIFPGKISRIVLSLIQYISIVFCGVIIYQHNGKNIVIFLFEIYGSYLVISYIKFADRFYVSVVTLILFFQWRIYKYYDKLEWCMEKERKQKKLEKAQKVERRWDVALLLLVLIALIIRFKDIGYSQYTKADSFEQKIEIIAEVKSDGWKDFSNEKKTKILQTIANAEGRKMRLSDRIEVYIGDIYESDVLAYYSDGQKKIVINRKYINRNEEELINSVIHEMFHASEHKYLVLYEKEIVPYSKAAEEKYLIYKSELGKDLSDEEYINAITEQDANIYAEQETNIFMKKIEKYEEEKNK